MLYSGVQLQAYLWRGVSQGYPKNKKKLSEAISLFLGARQGWGSHEDRTRVRFSFFIYNIDPISDFFLDIFLISDTLGARHYTRVIGYVAVIIVHPAPYPPLER